MRWIKNTSGKPDAMLTFAFLASSAASFAVPWFVSIALSLKSNENVQSKRGKLITTHKYVNNSAVYAFRTFFDRFIQLEFLMIKL